MYVSTGHFYYIMVGPLALGFGSLMVFYWPTAEVSRNEDRAVLCEKGQLT